MGDHTLLRGHDDNVDRRAYVDDHVDDVLPDNSSTFSAAGLQRRCLDCDKLHMRAPVCPVAGISRGGWQGV